MNHRAQSLLHCLIWNIHLEFFLYERSTTLASHHYYFPHKVRSAQPQLCSVLKNFKMVSCTEGQTYFECRKAVVKEEKAEKRRRREGHVDDAFGQKPCDLCETPKDLLIRSAAILFAP